MSLPTNCWEFVALIFAGAIGSITLVSGVVLFWMRQGMGLSNRKQTEK